METKHIKGEWKVAETGLSSMRKEILSEDLTECLAKVKYESDAKLIASAPELLKALQSLLDECLNRGFSDDSGADYGVLHLAEKTIKKATE